MRGIIASMDSAEVVVTMHMLETLLDGMREFLLKKETKHIQDALDEIRCLLDYDTSKISQVNMAIFTFSDSIQPVLRRLDIKPHWMFALSNLIQSAVQTAISLLSPDVSAQLHVQDLSTSVGQRTSVSRESGQSELEIVDSSRPPSREERREERKEYLNSIIDANDKLREKLIAAQEELKQHLISGIAQTQNMREMAAATTSLVSSALTNGMTTNWRGAPYRSTYPPTGFPPLSPRSVTTEELINWLRTLEIDERSIRLIVAEQYTKQDMFEYVTREELLALGVAGGATCRIWRAVSEARERARRAPVFLSPMRSRDDSLDDYHSSIADEMYTVAEMT
ncbi:hypothetical protein COOONC_14212 [Cooperia oncophora]